MQADYEISWSDLTLRDARTGRPPVVRARPGYHGYGTYPHSLTRRTIAGRKYIEASWMPSGSRATFATMADAKAFVQAHEEIAYGVPRASRKQGRAARPAPAAALRTRLG